MPVRFADTAVHEDLLAGILLDHLQKLHEGRIGGKLAMRRDGNVLHAEFLDGGLLMLTLAAAQVDDNRDTHFLKNLKSVVVGPGSAVEVGCDLTEIG